VELLELGAILSSRMIMNWTIKRG